jgi:putative effector of murein hydrolase
MKDAILEWTRQTLSKLGADPILFTTIICVAISVYHIRNFIKHDWDEIRMVYKVQEFATIFCTIILAVFTITKI